MKALRRLFPVLLILLLPSLLLAQRPLGPPIPVNPTASAVELSSLAMNARGDFVVTWVRQPVHAGDPGRLIARRFAADGTPATGEIVVDDQPAPVDSSRVVVRDDGSFVIVLNNDFPDLVARRYGADGAFEGETMAATRTLGRGYRLAPLTHGGFALAWLRDNGSFVRVFDAHADPVGPERRVGGGGPPAVAPQPDGGCVVTWIESKPTSDPRYGDPYLVAQRFAAGGERVGGRILVQGPLAHGVITSNEVASDAAGNFLVLWLGTIGSGPNADGIYARRFAADGTPLTARLKVEGRNALSPQLAMDRAGNFVVAWLQLAVGPNGQTGAFAQRITADGAPFRPAFRADTAGSGEPLVASDADGNFVVLWTQPWQIFAQRYRKR